MSELEINVAERIFKHVDRVLTLDEVKEINRTAKEIVELVISDLQDDWGGIIV